MDREEQLEGRRQQVSDYRSSGKTAALWCAENNIKVSTLRYWLNKLKREAKMNDKQEVFVEFKGQESARKGMPLIVKVGAVSIELYPGFQAETLREAIVAIRSL